MHSDRSKAFHWLEKYKQKRGKTIVWLIFLGICHIPLRLIRPLINMGLDFINAHEWETIT